MGGGGGTHENTLKKGGVNWTNEAYRMSIVGTLRTW